MFDPEIDGRDMVIDRLEAENARLREALEVVVETFDNGHRVGDATRYRVCERARAALKGSEPSRECPCPEVVSEKYGHEGFDCRKAGHYVVPRRCTLKDGDDQ